MFFKENMTEEEVELLSHLLTRRLRNVVLEDIHADQSKVSWSEGGYIPQEVMGPLQDAIRNCLYEMIHVFSQNPETKIGIEMIAKHIEERGGFRYPIEADERSMEVLRRTYSCESLRDLYE